MALCELFRGGEPVRVHSDRGPNHDWQRHPVHLRWLARQKFSTALVVVCYRSALRPTSSSSAWSADCFSGRSPFQDPDRLIYINETAPQWNLDVVGINFPTSITGRSGASCSRRWRCTIPQLQPRDERGAERIDGAVVTADFARVLGISPCAEDVHRRGGSARKLRTWSSSGRPLARPLWWAGTALGQTLKLNGVPHAIVGVMPKAAEFPGRVKLWVPLAGDPHQSYESYSYAAMGRMRPGVTIAAAETDLLQAHEPIWKARDNDRTVSPFAHSLRDEFVQDYRGMAGARSAPSSCCSSSPAPTSPA